MHSAVEAVDVVVVGAGVVGLACALACAQGGLRTALVGPAPVPYRGSAVAPFDERIYALSPASVALLTRLRVWPQVEAARVQAVLRMRVFGDEGAELRFDAFGAALERLATIVEESELLRVLAAGCAYAAGIVRRDTVFAGLQRSATAAQVQLADGSGLAARLVVGADGARSAVRAAAGIAAHEVSYRQTAVVANFAAARRHDGTAFQWFTDEGIVALLPLPDHEGQPAVSLVWSAPQALAETLLALSPQDLADRVARRTGGMLGTLAPLGAARGFPLRRLTAAAAIGPRLALIGDAAHVVHPLAGQGLNLGLGDVSELSAVLAAREPFRDLGDPVLLRRYERARAEPVTLMRATTDALARLFAAGDPVTRLARNAGLALVDRLWPVKRALIRHAVG